jgi:hypothetical protein
MKLTDPSVARLKPAAPGDSYIMRDDDLSGFHVRVSHKHKVYKLALDVRVNGKRKTRGWSWKETEFTVKAARAAAMKIVADRDAGTLQPDKVKAAEPAAITLDEAWKKYRVVKIAFCGIGESNHRRGVHVSGRWFSLR